MRCTSDKTFLFGLKIAITYFSGVNVLLPARCGQLFVCHRTPNRAVLPKSSRRSNGRAPGAWPAFRTESDFAAAVLENWKTSPLSRYKLLEGFEKIKVNTGVVDLLAVDDAKQEILVVEVKRKCASHRALGQLLGYMGDVAQAYPLHSVQGAIIAQGFKPQLETALAAVPTVQLYEADPSAKLARYHMPDLPNSDSFAHQGFHDGIEDAPLLKNWNATDWCNTHEILEARFEAGRGNDPLHIKIIARSKTEDEMLVIYTSGNDESFPILSKLILEMGTIMTHRHVRVDGVIVAPSALPRLLAALRAVPNIYFYRMGQPFSLQKFEVAEQVGGEHAINQHNPH
eukprot:TRINITY_DN65888_c0_g1_i1.p1 TRINITY_DN65888_c0_g1~~TRINITY_DN65888_c0_g1_i1.p1  ORF type:complete len:342 (-),score=51.24 TRINITY_DN65888_c0_g1_i1:133-1158(-)